MMNKLTFPKTRRHSFQTSHWRQVDTCYSRFCTRHDRAVRQLKKAAIGFFVDHSFIFEKCSKSHLLQCRSTQIFRSWYPGPTLREWATPSRTTFSRSINEYYGLHWSLKARGQSRHIWNNYCGALEFNKMCVFRLIGLWGREARRRGRAVALLPGATAVRPRGQCPGNPVNPGCIWAWGSQLPEYR